MQEQTPIAAHFDVAELLRAELVADLALPSGLAAGVSDGVRALTRNARVVHRVSGAEYVHIPSGGNVIYQRNISLLCQYFHCCLKNRSAAAPGCQPQELGDRDPSDKSALFTWPYADDSLPGGLLLFALSSSTLLVNNLDDRWLQAYLGDALGYVNARPSSQRLHLCFAVLAPPEVALHTLQSCATWPQRALQWHAAKHFDTSVGAGGQDPIVDPGCPENSADLAQVHQEHEVAPLSRHVCALVTASLAVASGEADFIEAALLLVRLAPAVQAWPHSKAGVAGNGSSWTVQGARVTEGTPQISFASAAGTGARTARLPA
jgi:hypothetical protein